MLKYFFIFIYSAMLNFAGAQEFEIFPGTTSYDSFYSGSKDPYEGGSWSNSKGGSAWTTRVFASSIVLTKVRIEMAGTDVSNKGSVISFEYLDERDQWHNLFTLTDLVINRGFSGNNRPNSIESQSFDLPSVTAKAVRLYMRGHGWFAARNIQLAGHIKQLPANGDQFVAGQIPSVVELAVKDFDGTPCTNCFDFSGFRTGTDCSAIQDDENAEITKRMGSLYLYRKDGITVNSSDYLVDVRYRKTGDVYRFQASLHCTPPSSGNVVFYLSASYDYSADKAPEFTEYEKAILEKYGNPNASLNRLPRKFKYIMGPNGIRNESKSDFRNWVSRGDYSPKSNMDDDLVSSANSFFDKGEHETLFIDLFPCGGKFRSRVCTVQVNIVNYYAYLKAAEQIVMTRKSVDVHVTRILEERRREADLSRVKPKL